MEVGAELLLVAAAEDAVELLEDSVVVEAEDSVDVVVEEPLAVVEPLVLAVAEALEAVALAVPVAPLMPKLGEKL